jgi:UDP-2,4-diacetamido-2,4,6-trideoxy-beta-L-altropyranose hydrolase
MQSRYTSKVPSHCALLMGPRYALLRDEFRQLHEQVRPRKGPVKRILVFFGGVDVDNYTGRAIEALTGIGESNLHIDVVIGAQHPCKEQIEAECALRGFICHIQTDKMAELMATADLAIGAGGSAAWERCCLGLPALLVALAENQIDIAKGLDLYGASVYVGTLEMASPQVLRSETVNLLSALNRFKALSENAYSLVDGLGIDRVRQEMSC